MPFGVMPYMPEAFATPTLVFLLAVSLMLMFVGRRFIDAIAWLVVGLVGAAIGVTFGSPFGALGSVIGFVGGFLIGGVASVFLLPLGLGFALAYVAYSIAGHFVNITLVPDLVAVVCFAYGLLLTDLLLPVVSSAVGGAIFFDIMFTMGTSSPEAAFASAGLASLGVGVQLLPGSSINFLRRKQTLVRQKSRGGRAPRSSRY